MALTLSGSIANSEIVGMRVELLESGGMDAWVQYRVVVNGDMKEGWVKWQPSAAAKTSLAALRAEMAAAVEVALGL